uniref:Uncharacterized protein n=1 Tax=Chlamydomonas euryale TaxID=1486919 RepID=A0A7R9VDU7_9CHLO
MLPSASARTSAPAPLLPVSGSTSSLGCSEEPALGGGDNVSSAAAGGPSLTRSMGRRAVTADVVVVEEPSRYGNMYRRPRTLSVASAEGLTPDKAKRGGDKRGDDATKSKMMRIRNVRFNRMAVKLSWTGVFSFNDFIISLDPNSYTDVVGANQGALIKSVMNRHKGRFVASAMKSMIGMQQNKSKMLESGRGELQLDAISLEKGINIDSLNPALKAAKVPAAIRNHAVKAIKQLLNSRRKGQREAGDGRDSSAGDAPAADVVLQAIKSELANFYKTRRLSKLLGKDMGQRSTASRSLMLLLGQREFAGGTPAPGSLVGTSQAASG